MAQVCGLIISETEPTKDNNYAWFKPSVNKYYAMDTNGDWVETASITFSWNSLVDKPVGLTGTRTVGGYRFTFTDGLLTGFQTV